MIRQSFATLLALCCLTLAATAQEKVATPDGLSEDSDKPAAPTKVEVEPEARDGDIAERLEQILEATGWFRDPTVAVREGVVFLEGEALEPEFQTWASELASSTQDVAAVVNRMSIQQKSIWDMTPAMAELKEVLRTAIQTSPLFLFGLIVVAVTWLLARLTRWLTRIAIRHRIGNTLLQKVVVQTSMVPVVLLGIYILLRVSGLTQLALTVLGGTGLAGLIIGIAFRDIAENFLASILISIQNPFRSGDLVEVDGHLGFVQRVSTRGTLLMTYDGNHVQIPNAVIYKSTILNYSANPNRRVEFIVGIGYDDSISEAQRVIKDVLDEHPAVLADPEPRIILHELAASTVNLRVFLWLDASKNNPDVVRSSAMRMTTHGLLQRGISLPDEAREVVFPNDVPVRMMESADKTNGKQAEPAGKSPTRSTNQKQSENVVSAGEGDLENDAAEIQRQATRSWEPDPGTDLLDNRATDLTTSN